MAEEIFNRIKKLYFLGIAVLMYYFLTEVINLGIFITFRHVFALVIFGSAFVLFLIKPNIARGITASKDALLYSTPFW